MMVASFAESIAGADGNVQGRKVPGMGYDGHFICRVRLPVVMGTIRTLSLPIGYCVLSSGSLTRLETIKSGSFWPPYS